MSNLSLAAFASGILALFGMALPTYTPFPKALPVRQEIKTVRSLDNSFTANSVLVFNLKTGERAVDFGSDVVLPVASITKIMTGFLVLEALNPGEFVMLSEDAARTSGDVGHLKAGEYFAVADFLRATMMSSSNDAAMALAEEAGARMGGQSFEERIALFVEAMNRKAEELKMHSTRFVNPTGLDSAPDFPSNYSTAADLALLIRAAYEKTPILWEFSREKERTIYSDRGRAYHIFHLNEILDRIPNLIGSKTGSTSSAGDSLVYLFEYPLGTAYGAIMIGAENGKRAAEAERILELVLRVLP
ncbi:MAG: D-alanyl-D-alanine carboxypeptidase [Candidatus Ryanbacteria bacterium]|nr:D-alanyl-D-alanine carboxypeptidase [Candidatus Ryanbacteria bacterium]